MQAYKVIGENGEERIYECASPGAAVRLAAADGIKAVRIEPVESTAQ